MVVAPATLHVPLVKETLRSDVQVALQNCGRDAGAGAFTGEISPEMIKDFGLSWVITGHSERRVGFGSAGESSELVAQKTKVALDTGLNVMACIGESLDEREAGNTLKVVLEEQLAAIAKPLSISDWDRVVIACKYTNDCLQKAPGSNAHHFVATCCICHISLHRRACVGDWHWQDCFSRASPGGAQGDPRLGLRERLS